MQTASIMANRELGGKREEFFVTSGNTSQRRCALKMGDYAEWNFREMSEHGVDAAVYFVRQGATKGDEVEVRAMLRRKIDAQSFTATEAGELVFMFDNTFSWWTDKQISLEIRKQAIAPTKSTQCVCQPASNHSEPPCPNVLISDDDSATMSPDISECDEAAVHELLRAEAEWASSANKRPGDRSEQADPEPEPEQTSMSGTEPAPELQAEPERT